MAIYGSLGEVNLASLSASISDTAVDIFIYDTSKDSDGGAWRKRTQHTSWYNETLGTATRGTRREFPAVAVIVAESNQVTIYDGDDPDLPMWMVFNGLSYQYMIRSGTNCISALNGILCVGNVSNHGLIRIEFIADRSKLSHSSGDAQRYFKGNISQRNSTNDYDYGYPALWDPIVNGNVNDVAMTVLPNAPIDDATGLPVPTIAVATDGGVSVIKDDGNVYDLTSSQGSYNTVTSVQFNSNGDIIYDGFNGNSNADGKAIRIDEIPSTDRVVTTIASQLQNSKRIFHYGDWYFGAGDGTSIGNGVSKGGKFIAPTNDPTDINFGESVGVSKVKLGNTDNRFDASVCLITSSHNTGWMNGDIKGAFLSDTDATNVTGGGYGLITGSDSTFDDVITNLNWSERSGSGGAWNVSGGVLKTGTVSSGEYLDITTSGYTSGQTYVISYTLANVTGSMPLRWRFNNGQMGDLPTSNGSHSYYVTLTETGTLFSILNDANLTADIDNFKLQLVQEEDRSVNNKGLTAYGTITKSPVAGSGATAAELVGYGPFSSSNYLVQPYNSDLDFGTGDYYFTYWMKSPIISSDQAIFQQGDYSLDKGIFTLVWNSGGSGNSLQVGDGGGNVVVEGHESEGWIQIFATRQNGVISVYKNGSLVGTNTSTKNINYSSSGLGMVIGNMTQGGSTGSFPYGGSLALFRVGTSTPSTEQIKKIYEDEKVLFQENAACTLYGSSDAVTALAYDDSTNLLYAGTSSGRSDFQGLRRINNTTTAVTTAMSASNGLVAEQ